MTPRPAAFDKGVLKETKLLSGEKFLSDDRISEHSRVQAELNDLLKLLEPDQTLEAGAPLTEELADRGAVARARARDERLFRQPISSRHGGSVRVDRRPV